MSGNIVLKTSEEDLGDSCSQVCKELLSKIVDLTERIDVFSWGLLNYYTDVYLTTNTSRSLELMNYNNRKYRALKDLDELQIEIESYRKENGQNSCMINNTSKKLDAVVDAFNKSCILVEGTYIVQAAVKDLKSLKYVDALTKLNDLHRKLDKMDFTGDVATALKHFRTLSENQLVTVQGQLSVEWSNLFKWNFYRTINTLKFSLSVQQKDPILLKTVVEALYKADQIMVELQGFSEFFILDVLPNIIKYNCEISIEDHVGALIFTIQIDLPGTGQPSIPTIFNNLTAVFEFLDSTVAQKLEREHKFIKTFGDCNRDEFFSKIIHDCIKSNLPCCENSARAYKEIVIELETFNTFLVNLNYMEETESPFKKYIDHVDLLLYDTKCNKLLTEARKLLKESISRKPIIVGETCTDDYGLDDRHRTFTTNSNIAILFPLSKVSENVKKVGTLITGYLEECIHLPADFGNQLAYYIKDIAIMYECMVAERNNARLKRNALEIALYFNNCNYLAHTMIGPPWKNKLPRDLANCLNTTLMPHIYDLRVVGMEKLSLYLKRKKEVLSARIGGDSNEPINNWNHEEFEVFNKDVNSCIRCLQELRDTWTSVLPRAMFVQAMCCLIGAVCEAMTTYVFTRIEKTTESMIITLLFRFRSAADELSDLFRAFFFLSEKGNKRVCSSRKRPLPPMDNCNQFQGISKDETAVVLPVRMEEKVKTWNKFVNVHKLLKASLMEIGAMWVRGDSQVRCFPCENVRRIIKIRFPNSKYRLKILKEIQ